MRGKKLNPQNSKITGKFFKGRRILVCGGAGFIGTNLILALLDANAKVKATYHVKKPQLSDTRVKFIKADLTKSNDCQLVVRDVDYVFMCAANSSGAAVIQKTPLVHVTPNVIMNAQIMEAAHKAKVKKFLFISSNTVYPPFAHPVRENEVFKGDPFDKYFPVAWMKRFGEIMCQMYTEKIKDPMISVVIRPANTYGPYDDFEPETSHVIPALVRKVVEKNDPVEVWGDGKDVKDLIYIEDLVGGILLAMAKVKKFMPLNIATGKSVSVNKLLKTIIKLEGAGYLRLKYNKSAPTMIRRRMLDISLAKKTLGFEAVTTLGDGLKQTISWYKSH